MKTTKALVFFVMLVFLLSACTKKEMTDPVFSGKPLLSRVDASGQYYAYTYDNNFMLTGIHYWVSGSSSAYFSFMYNGKQLVSTQTHSVYYDANGIPASASNKFSYNETQNASVQETDSAIIRTEGGKVVYKGYYAAVKQVFDPTHNPTVYTINIRDSIATYRLTYAGGNIAKIHTELKSKGMVVDEEFTWGTRRGISSNMESLPLVCPELTINGFLYISLFSKNELLNYTRTQFPENRKYVYDYLYQYNLYGYPTLVIETLSGSYTNKGMYEFTYN